MQKSKIIISDNILQKKIYSRTTISFYKYFIINNTKMFRDIMYATFNNLNILGRIYISKEGINAQISIPNIFINKISNILSFIHYELNSLFLNIAINDKIPSFFNLKIKIRSHILYDGIKDKNFNFFKIKQGIFISPKFINIIIHDPNIIFVDIRNYYEYEIGHFKNAIQIPSDTFREQLSILVDSLKNFKNKKIVLYCTGGIRCEKASAWLLYNGFKKIFQIKGGIISYVRFVKEKKLPIYFIGKIFVFDGRLSEKINLNIISNCHQCGISCDNHTNCRNNMCNLLFIQCLNCFKKYNGCCKIECQTTLNNLLINKNNQIDKNHNYDINFNKSRKKLLLTFPYLKK